MDLCLKNLGRGTHVIIVRLSSSKCSETTRNKCFSSTLEREAGVFKYFRFQERFRKAPFSWWISADGRPNCRNKAAFSNFFHLQWTGPSDFRLNVVSLWNTLLSATPSSNLKRFWVNDVFVVTFRSCLWNWPYIKKNTLIQREVSLSANSIFSYDSIFQWGGGSCLSRITSTALF